jgi:hypothetical protein
VAQGRKEVGLGSLLGNLTEPHPLASLKALTAIDREINAAFEQTRERLIRRALRLPLVPSWDQIGQALGMSKTAANRKYGGLAPGGRVRSRR